jgi:hypothetical protein
MSQPTTTQLIQKEVRIALAIEALKQGQLSSIRATAKAYDVPFSTLRYRVNKHPAPRDYRPASYKLTEIEGSILVRWILFMDERGLVPRSDTIRQMANLLLQKRGDQIQGNPPTVGKLWAYNFVRRYQELKSRYNQKYDY